MIVPTRYNDKHAYLLCFVDNSRTAKHLAHLHGREELIDSRHLLLRETDVGSSDILLQSAQAACAWYWHNPRFLAHHPCQRYLRRSGMLLHGKLFYHFKKTFVLLETVLLILRHYCTIVSLRVKNRLGVVTLREQAVGKWRESHKPYTKFLHTGKRLSCQRAIIE